MANNDIKANIDQVIRDVAQMRNIAIPHLQADLEIVDDLGFTSLAVAALIANLEEVFGVDPFEDEHIMITDLRTVGDIYRLYESICLEKNEL